MRLSMMPTARKKLGGIGLFTRQADGPASMPVSSNPLSSPNPRPSTVGLPLGPGLPSTRELQPPPEIVTARQERDSLVPAALAVRALPAPKPGRFSSTYPSSANAPGAASTSLPSPPAAANQLHLHPMHRTRTSASETGPRDNTARTANAWEDSTVASMFGDSEGRPASDRFRAQSAIPAAAHPRQHSDAGHQRTVRVSPTKRIKAPQHQHQNQNHAENLPPFMFGDGGLLKVISQPPTSQNRLATVSSGVLHDPPSAKEEHIHEQQEYVPFETTPTKLNPVRYTRAPPKDIRELPRGSFSPNGFSSEANSLDMSPERRLPQMRPMSPDRPTEPIHAIEKIRMDERVQERQRREREMARELELQEQRELAREQPREQPRELHHKRSTVFEHVEPVSLDEPTFNNTRAAVVGPVESSTNSSPKSVTEAAQRTPRQPPRQPLPAPPAYAGFPPANAPPMGPLDNSLTRTGHRRFKPPTAPSSKESKKRRLSPDYNDADLHRMSYADLLQQDFDYDPQQAALQQPPRQPSAPLLLNPEAASLEDRLEFYQKQGGLDQHTFFTRMPMREWDEAGDWFLARFGDVVNRMREARKNKRKLVEAFETEISTREEAVRVKVEGIAKTLEDFKAEGRSMMEGKEMDLEA